ncbi:hypothetical protein [Nostoc sp.]|uniref:hypothetical protein n=1 Tax=Nostoc sp. TaxID=1180 RepID=UPI002FF8C8CA
MPVFFISDIPQVSSTNLRNVTKIRVMPTAGYAYTKIKLTLDIMGLNLMVDFALSASCLLE